MPRARWLRRRARLPARLGIAPLPPRQPPGRWKLLNKLGLARPHPYSTNRVFFYPEVVTAMLARPPVDYPRIPSVVPSWDNTARRRNGGATILHGSTPEAYGYWLRSVLADHPTLNRLPEPIVFINAWNEWAEGNHLEPDLQWRHRFLRATQKAISND